MANHPLKPSLAPSDTLDVPREPSAAGETDPHLTEPGHPSTEPELDWLAHYRILKVLGRGGMGVVLLAEDTHLQRCVALKVILAEYADSLVARERFLREARTAAAIKNDHVVTIYQVGQDRDIPFMAMEFLEGQSLHERLAGGEQLSAAEVLRIAREIATGLAAAHGLGVIHRDIKPANIWLEAPAGRVKLLDFGLARAAKGQSNLTQTGGVVGTPEFMSPEQARGQDLDARSDLFSFGAVLYTLCSGQKPFQGKSVMAVLTALAVDTPRPVQELNPDVPPSLAALVERLLEKDPARRPASAAEVRQALLEIESGQATTATLPRSQVIPTPAAPPAPRRSWPFAVLAGIALLGAAAWFIGWLQMQGTGPSGPPLRIGVLHSRTGTMALSEKPVSDAVLLAVEEINARGGLLGRPVEPVLADGASDETTFAEQAEALIQNERVAAIFGCWTSASRKAVVPVVERHDHLLLYPVQYEGVEQSPNVVYLGPVPNQQIVPSLRWIVGFEGKRRWFIVGSDYVFPRTAGVVIHEEARRRGCTIVGEEYRPLGCTDVGDIVKKIVAAKPDLIINTINGDTNISFFRELRRAGVTAKEVPTLSFSISTHELYALGPRATAGDYVATNYLPSLDLPANREFKERIAQRFGPDQLVSSPMETAYAGVHLWAQAVESAGTDDVPAVRQALRGRCYDAPRGPIRIDPETLHTHQFTRIGRLDETGQRVEVFVSPQPIPPEPFPTFRTRAEWAEFLADLHQRWGGRWSITNP